MEACKRGSTQTCKRTKEENTMTKKLLTDTEMLDWLTTLTESGISPGLVHDDNGHWALSDTGAQEVADGGEPQDLWIAYLVLPNEWYNTPREAIQAAWDAQQEDKEDG
jgi:hypothetical protein